VLASGRRRLVAMFADLKVVEVPVESLRDVDPDLLSLFNVNTPEDLQDARESLPAEEKPVVRPVVVHAADERRAGRMPSERPVTVFMNDVEVATTQATPTDLEELGVGFLLSEGLITDRAQFRSVDADRKRGLVYVESLESVPDELVYKTRYITSGCGKGITFSSVGHARDLEKVTSEIVADADTLHTMMRDMNGLASAYRDTGGMHACGLARFGKVLLVREDVGRHNAVDKLLGRAWLDHISTADAVLLTTGRVSYEMAVKAAKSRVPIVVSRSAVTDLAAEIGEELGITLAGYCRGGGIVLYTHPERVIAPQTEGQ
jgi:FdhD protein